MFEEKKRADHESDADLSLKQKYIHQKQIRCVTPPLECHNFAMP
jgi:hypothetical protein